ncbi:MAG: hypothetical protein ACRDTE_05975 [Pseudonocardiaceae bacterium]
MWVLVKFVIALSISVFTAVQENLWVGDAVAATEAGPLQRSGSARTQ